MMDALLDITQMTAGRLFDRFERVRLDGQSALDAMRAMLRGERRGSKTCRSST
jgi:hypothetical protein